MRALTAPAVTALSGDSLVLVVLVEMMLTLPVRVCSASVPVVYNGNTYLGAGTLGSVEAVDDSPGEFKNLVFTLAGVANDLLSVALNEPIRGKLVRVRNAILDPATGVILDAPLFWTGALDQMPIELGKEASTISVTAEHRGVTFGRPKPLNYTDADQRRITIGTDTSLKTIQSQSTHNDVWPNASFGRR
jgi:hypothetical protein